MNALDALTRLVAEIDSYPAIGPAFAPLVSDARAAIKAETPVVSNDARAIIGGFVDLLKRVGVVKGSDAERLMLQAADFLDGPCKGDADEAARFWRGVSAVPGLTSDEVKSELIDFYFFMDQARLVYTHATGGVLSKPNYPAATVKALIDDHVNELVRKATEERFGEARAKMVELGAALGMRVDDSNTY